MDHFERVILRQALLSVKAETLTGRGKRTFRQCPGAELCAQSGMKIQVVGANRRLRSLTLVGASDESQVFFVQEVLKSWFSAV